MRLIDADKIEPTEIYDGEWVRVAYMDDIDELPTVDVDSLNAKHEDIGYEKGYRDGYAEALEVTDDAEPVRHGHWCVTQAYPHTVYCSECFQRFAQAHWAVWEDGSLPRDYCPHCGAKMDEVRDE